MTLYPLPSELGLGGGAGLHDHEVLLLKNALAELQRFRTAVVAGDTANADIVVPGLASGDTLQSVIEYAAGVPADRTADSSIDAAGNLNIDDDTSGNTVVVSWYGHSA